MEGSNASAGGGENDTSAKSLSREEVMAQRAEKKKLKEARKNKSLVGGVNIPEKSAKPQQKQLGKEQAAPVVSKGEQDKKSAVPPHAQKNQSTKAAKNGKPPNQEPKPATVKENNAGATNSTTKNPSPPETESKVPEESGETVQKEQSVLTGKSQSEFQSTIQSLFPVKKAKHIKLHALFYSLGVKLKHDVIRGANARCIALLHTIRDFVEGYQTPPGVSFKYGLSSELQLNLAGLRAKCPFGIGMNNATEFLNAFLYQMDQDVGDVNQQKEEIMSAIDQYIEEKIAKAVEAIIYYAVEKAIFRTGDVILIYSITDAVLNLLEKVAEKDTFEIILIQTPETMPDVPLLLMKLGKLIQMERIRISSVNFSNAIYRIPHCTKMLIGGHGLFTTGGVMAQSGSGKLALLAATFNKPAIFLCETYKFCDRSPLDFFTLDEYMPEQSITEDELFEPKIKYDVTPANLVTVVITDIELLPSTSVPVVLRVQESRTAKKISQCIESY